MGDVIVRWVSPIVALVGLLQYWAVAAIRKWLVQGKVDIYETGSVEVGYGGYGYGPTIGVGLTLRASSKSVFVTGIELLLLRKKDSAKHIFRWAAFRKSEVDLGADPPAVVSMPYAFLIALDAPMQLNVLFQDQNTLEEITGQYREYVQAWSNVVEELQMMVFPEQRQVPPEVIARISAFKKEKIHTDMFGTLDRRCYWEAGEYELLLTIATSKPNRVFAKEFLFSLSEENAKHLSLNVINVLEGPISKYLQRPSPPFYFALAEFKAVDS